MSMKKRILSVLLAVVMAFGIMPPAMAYDSPDFSDLPASHWAYDAAMRMADQGVILGTGNGEFSPTLKVSAAQFLTLVGRAVFTEEAMAQLTDNDFEFLDISRDSWYGPYMVASWTAGINSLADISFRKPDAEITRIQMAVVLTRAITVKYEGFGFGLGNKEVDTTAIKDYASIPDEYKDYVAQTYAYGLIQGDEKGNFNGEDTMTRAEVAVVMDRLVEQFPALKEAQAKKEAAEEIEKQALRDAYDPYSVELQEGERVEIYEGYLAGRDLNGGRYEMKLGDTVHLIVKTLPAGYDYTRADVKWTSNDESVATVVRNDDGTATVTAVGEGIVRIEASVPVIYSPSITDPTGFHWTTSSSWADFIVVP